MNTPFRDSQFPWNTPILSDGACHQVYKKPRFPMLERAERLSTLGTGEPKATRRAP